MSSPVDSSPPPRGMCLQRLSPQVRVQDPRVPGWVSRARGPVTAVRQTAARWEALGPAWTQGLLTEARKGPEAERSRKCFFPSSHKLQTWIVPPRALGGTPAPPWC